MFQTARKIWHEFLIPCLLIFLIFISFLTPAFASEVILHEESQSFPVTGGVIYESKTLFTSKGWQRIHILRVDLSSDNVDIDSLIGSNGLSNRDSLSNMVKNSGAVAGINGDFFVTATPSAPIGPQISNGKLVSSPQNLDGMGTIGITFDKIPKILKMNFTGKLKAPDGSEFPIEGINKIKNSYNNIFVYTPDFGRETPPPGEKAPELTFVTVKSDKVVDLSKGRTAPIPDDGLVLMAWGDGAEFLKNHFSIGSPVEMEFEITPDISNLKMALGGGAILVEDGRIPESFLHNIPGTHPRTAIGFTEDKKTIIMAVVDGRQAQSRGMTQQEMAQLMLDLGAHDALNLDGGGSSTMVVKPFWESSPKVINSVSEGTQRLIPNGIGVFAKSSTGKVYGLKIEGSSFNIPLGGKRTFSVKAYDKNYNLVDIDKEKVKWSITEDLGYFNGSEFIAQKSGTAKVVATYKNIKAFAEIRVLKDNILLSIEPLKTHVNLGSKAEFKVVVTDSEGYRAPLEPSDINWNMIGELGTFDGSKFLAQKAGSGAVIAEFAGLKASALVQTGYERVLLDDFENEDDKFFDSYPKNVNGSFMITSIPDPVYSGKFSGRLFYDFSAADYTQAAYLNFGKEGKPIPIDAKKLSLWVYGQGNGEWVRLTLTDASGSEITLDVAKSVDWSGWKQLQLQLPSGKKPFKLKRIYVVETSAQRDFSGAIYFDELAALLEEKYDESLMIPQPLITDPANKPKEDADFSFAIVGGQANFQENSTPYDKILSKASDIVMDISTDFNIYLGQVPEENDEFNKILSHIPNLKISKREYSLESTDNANFIFLSAAEGSLRSTDYTQWTKLKQALENLDTSQPLFVVLDESLENFDDLYEGELIKKVLTQHANSTDSQLWIISRGSRAFFSKMEEGVHYVSIPSLESDEPAVAVFNISESGVSYQVYPLIEKILPQTFGAKAGRVKQLKIYGLTPTGSKILLGYPYSAKWEIAFDKPFGFDPNTLSFKSIDTGKAKVSVNVSGISASFDIQITDLTVLLNGKEINFPDQVPYINEDSRTMVPVRFVSESLGADVEWDNDNRMVIIKKDDTVIKLKIGESKADVNGKIISFDTKAMLKNSRTMVPVRFISEALGAEVTWNQGTKTVEIKY